jgi:hypothetical protein
MHMGATVPRYRREAIYRQIYTPALDTATAGHGWQCRTGGCGRKGHLLPQRVGPIHVL